MTKAFLTAVLLALLLIPSGALSLSAGDVDIYPLEPVVSAGSSFIVIVRPGTTERPVRITWSAFGGGLGNVGSFPEVNGKFVCYFSNTDSNATCGPTPFTSPGEMNALILNVVTPSGIQNLTFPVNVTNLQISTQNVDLVDNTLYLYIISDFDRISYSIMNGDFDMVINNQPLVYNATNGRFEGQRTLTPGTYYVLFNGQKGSQYASAVKRFYIPSTKYVTMTFNKARYYLGELVTVSGQASGSAVTGELRYPNGTKAMDIVIPVTGGSFSDYSFRLWLSWPQGTDSLPYKIHITEPLVKDFAFTAGELFSVNPASLAGNVDKGKPFTATVSIQNLGDNATNISITTTGEVKSQWASLSSGQLAGVSYQGSSATITLTIPAVNGSITGSIKITSDTGIELEIPVRVGITGVQECPECKACPACAASKLTVYPATSYFECMDGKDVQLTLTLVNNGDSSINDLSFDVQNGGGDEDFTELGINSDNIDSLTVSPGSANSEAVNFVITPSSAGVYSGSIIIKSGGSSVSSAVTLSCYENLEDRIDQARTALETSSLASSEKTRIESYLDAAAGDISSGSYSSAFASIEKADTLMAAYESGGSSGGGFQLDFMTIIIILVVAVIAVVALLFLRGRGGGGKEKEEQLEEEF